MRQPIQVLVILFRHTEQSVEYLLLRRVDLECWQGVAGGVDADETPIVSALRESFEETGATSENLVVLDSFTTIPVEFVTGFLWGETVLLVQEFAFGLEVDTMFEVTLSIEHTAFKWCEYEEACKELEWDSNRNALWELNHRLRTS